MFFKAWSAVAKFVTKVRSRTLVIVLWSLLASVSETFSLTVAVRVGLAVGGGEDGGIEIPLINATLPAVTLITAALATAVVALLAHVAIARLSSQMTASVIENSRREAVAAFVGASWEVQSAEREGALQESVSTLSRNSSIISQNVIQVLSNAIMLAVFATFALVISPLATVVVVAAGAVLALALRPIARATHRNAIEFTRAGTKYAEDISKFSSTSMEYKVFGVQAAAAAQLDDVAREVVRAQQRTRFMALLGSSMFRDFALLLLVLAVAALVFNSGLVDASAAIVVITLIVRALASAQQVNTATQSINEWAPNIFMLRANIQKWASGRVQQGSRAVPSNVSEWRLQQVQYTYPGTNRGIGPIDLLVTSGESVGIVGKSGAGKSTLVQVLLRLRHPTEGAVLADGVDYREFSEVAWSEVIGFVPQEPSLLEATIAENIDFSRGLDLELILQAARDAHVYDDIMELPEGFDTRLGPRGAGLSGGQKQRIAIARALAAQPRVILLDEPSSALDQRSEAALAQTLHDLKGHTTLIIVAHRMATIESCDRVVVMEGGRVVDVGTPNSLIHNGAYEVLLRSEDRSGAEDADE